MNESNVQRRHCGVEGCESPVLWSGLCSKHYARFLKYGDPKKCKRRMEGTRSYVDGDVGYIELTRGQWAMVDSEDFERVNRYRWRAVQTAKGDFYAAGNVGVRGAMCHSAMHIFVMSPTPGYEVDHVSRCKLDNRKRNLRHVKKFQNSQNRGNDRNKSGYKGVVWREKCKKWEANIMLRGKAYYLGHFDNAKDAARAYNRKARELGFIFVPPDPE